MSEFDLSKHKTGGEIHPNFLYKKYKKIVK